MTLKRYRRAVDSTAEPDFPRGIGAPATRALTGAGYRSFRELAGIPRTELAALHGVGPKALRIIQEALESHGESLG